MTLATPSSGMENRTVGGVPFAVTSLDGAAEWLVSKSKATDYAANVRLANAYNVVLANRDEAYGSLMRDHGINLPDGAPVARLMTRRGKSETSLQVRGPSLFPLTMELGVSAGVRHFFLGGSPRTLNLLVERVSARFPGVQIAGAYSPPYRPIDDRFIADCRERVMSAAPDLVWVGLGTPKQDYVGTALAESANVLAVNVGAAFDFTAGTVTEPPKWIQGTGWEWIHRLASEPRRLWRRYLVGNAQFVAIAASSYFSDRRPSR